MSGVRVLLASGGADNLREAAGDVHISIEHLRGSNSSDMLIGSATSNRIEGLAGNDTIYGEGGGDTLDGGEGIDFIYGGDDGDTIIHRGAQFGAHTYGGGGLDTLDLSGWTDATRSFSVDLKNGWYTYIHSTTALFPVYDLQGVEFVIGSDFCDRLLGSLTNGGILRGGAGDARAAVQLVVARATVDRVVNDVLLGGAGNDTYAVDASGYRTFETTTSGIDAGGIDTVRSAVTFSLDANAGVRFVENLVLTGTDNLNGTGNALANRLTGNAGNNVLNGGLGANVMIGGAGKDTFVFNSALGGDNVDRITDFNVVDDRIRLDDAIFVGPGTGVLGASVFAANLTGQAGTASERIIYETDTGRLFYDSDGVGGAARVQFATLTTGLTLKNADFFVF